MKGVAWVKCTGALDPLRYFVHVKYTWMFHQWYRVWREWLGSSAQEHWTRWDIDTCTKHLVNISTGLVLLCTGPKPFPSYSISWAWWNIHVYLTCTKHLNGSNASMHWTQATPFILYITSLMKHPCVLNVYKTSQRVQCSYALDPIHSLHTLYHELDETSMCT